MDSESVQCTVCKRDYDLSENLPRILPRCGHTVCTSCLGDILKGPEPRCPLDKRSFALDQVSLENFPINIALRRVIMENLEWEVCPIHQEKIKLVCIDDRLKLCAYCALFRGHRDHEIKTLAELQPQLIENLQKLQIILKNLNRHYREIQDATENTRHSLLEIIETKFNQLIETILKKKTKLTTEIEKYFTKQKKILENSFGENSPLTSNVVEKIIDYEAKLKARDIFNLLEDDISEFLVRFDEKIMLNNIQNLNLDLNETTRAFEDSLESQITFIRTLKVPALGFTSNYSKLYAEFSLEELSFHSQTSLDSEPAMKTENILENSMRSDLTEQRKGSMPPASSKSQVLSENSLKSSSLEIKSRIRFKIIDKTLEIMISNRVAKAFTITSDQWNKLKQAHITLDKFDFNQEDLESFKSCWKTLNSITKIKFDCAYQEHLQDDNLKELLLIVFAQPENLTDIEINFENTILGDASVNLLINDVLPKASLVTNLKLNLENTNISDNKISNLSQSVLKALKQLENLTLNLKKTNLTEHAISELFILKPSLKKIDFTFDETSLSDWGLEKFVQSMLVYLSQIEELQLWLANTKVTDKGATKLFQNLPDLRKFRLSFQSTGISDQSVEKILAENKLYNMKHLEDFGLYLEDTKVSEHVKLRINEIRSELCD